MNEKNLSQLHLYIPLIKDFLIQYRDIYKNFILTRISAIKTSTDIHAFVKKISSSIPEKLNNQNDKDFIRLIDFHTNKNNINKVTKAYNNYFSKLMKFTENNNYINNYLPLALSPITELLEIIYLTKTNANLNINTNICSTDMVLYKAYNQVFSKNLYLKSIIDKTLIPSSSLEFSYILENSNDKFFIECAIFYVSKYFNDFDIEKNLLNHTHSESITSINSFKDIVCQVKLLPLLLISIEKIHFKITKSYNLFDIYFKNASNRIIISPYIILQNLANLYFHKNVCIATYINSLSKKDLDSGLNLITDFESIYAQINLEIVQKELVDLKVLEYLLSRLESILIKLDTYYQECLSFEKNIQESIRKGDYKPLQKVLSSYDKQQNYKNLLTSKSVDKSSDYDKHLKKINKAIDANKYQEANILAKKLSFLTIQNNYYSLPKFVKYHQTPPISQNVKQDILKRLQIEDSDTLRSILNLEEKYWEVK